MITVLGPADVAASISRGIHAAGAAFWPLAVARELDDAILHLRLNEPALGLLVLRTEGDPARGAGRRRAAGGASRSDWLVREIRLLLKRVLKRLDLTSRSLIALIEPGSCFAGTLAELVFAADRAVMFAARAAATIAAGALHLSTLNFGAYPMGNGLTRLATRFLGRAGQRRAGRGGDRGAAGCARRRRRWGWSRRRSTTATGTTRCG